MSKKVQPSKRSHDEKAEAALQTIRRCTKRRGGDKPTDPTPALKNFFYHSWRAGKSLKDFGTTDAELREITYTYEVGTGDRILSRLQGKVEYSARQRHHVLEEATRVFINAGLTQEQIDLRLRPYKR